MLVLDHVCVIFVSSTNVLVVCRCSPVQFLCVTSFSIVLTYKLVYYFRFSPLWFGLVLI